MRKRSLALLLVLSMLATLMIGVMPAQAAGDIEALTVPTVSDANGQTLGTIKVTVPGGSIKDGDTITFKLPSDWDFPAELTTAANIDNSNANPPANLIYVPDTINASGDDNGLLAGDLTLTTVNADDEYILKCVGTDQAVYDFVFYIYLRDIDVASGTDGECVVTFDGPNGSGFPQGTVTVAKVVSDGSVTLSVTDDETSNGEFDCTIRVKEDVAGSLELGSNALKFILPDGYEWDTAEDVGYTQATALWGADIGYSVDVDEDELVINFLSSDTDDDQDLTDEAAAVATNVASAWQFTFTFNATDEEDCEPGDVVAKVKGETSSTPSTLVVGAFGDFGVKITADEPTTVFAGKCEQEIANIQMEETIDNSLIEDRYVTMTLPSWAKWTSVPDPVEDTTDLEFKNVSGTDGQTVKYQIINAGGDATELEFEDMEIALDATADGDVKVTFGGNSGITGEVIVAKVAKSVTAAAAGKPDIKIGVASQKTADLTLTEVSAGSISKEDFVDATGNLVLKVPAGVEFAKIPTVTVTTGDLEVDTTNIRRAKAAPGGANVDDLYHYIIIPIDGESTVASTITVSDIFVTVDRTVAEGDLKISALGSAILESNSAYSTAALGGPNVDVNDDGTDDYETPSGLFPQTLAYTAAVAGTVVTPAPEDQEHVAIFTIGSTTYKVNGIDQTADVAPYIKDGRTFLPVRYVALAIGVDPTNIIWDEAAQTVTLLKGDSSAVVQLKIGSTTMLVNGIAISMDVAPEIVDGRTMLPLRFLANAFGLTTTWDAATNTVTIQ